MRQDLPAPLCPSRPTTTPGYKSMEAWSTGLTPPKAIETSFISTKGVWALASMGSTLGGSAAVEGVEADRADEHHADHHLLEGRVQPEQHHARLQRLDDQRADERPVDRAHAAGERGAADDRGGDHVKLVELSEHIGRRIEPRRIDASRDPRQRAHQRTDENRDALGVDAGELGGLRVAAGRVDIAAKPGAPG